MRKLQIKFPSQIRISGWDFGSSARAMNQAGGKDGLMTYESVPKTQADLVKVTKSTTERKSMSTKTSIKRIALVAVSALGLGVITSVSPASAAFTVTEVTAVAGTGILTTSSMSMSATTAGRLGAPVIIKATINATPDGTDEVAVVGARFSGAVPSGSALTGDSLSWFAKNNSTVSGNLGSTAGDLYAPVVTAVSAGTEKSGAEVVDLDTTDGDATNDGYNGLAIDFGAATATASTATVYLKFTPDKVGTYNVQLWNDADLGEDVDAAEQTKTLSIVVTDQAISTISVTAKSTAPMSDDANTSANLDGVNTLVQIQLKNAAGTPVIPQTSETIAITVNGSGFFDDINMGNAVFGSSVTGAPTALTLTSTMFDQLGRAWVEVGNTAAGTVTVSASVDGGTATGSGNLTTVDSSGNLADEFRANSATPTGYVMSTDNVTVSNAASSISLIGETASLSLKTATLVVDTDGALTGLPGAKYLVALTAGAANNTLITAPAATLTLAPAFSFVGQTFDVEGDSQTAQTFTSALSAVSDSLSLFNVDTVSSVAGAKVTVTVNTLDQFSSAKEGLLAAFSVSGRNTVTTGTNVITDADGNATFSYTDAGTSGSDTISVTVGGTPITDSVTVSFDANNAVSTVVMDTPNTTAGVANTAVVNKAINAGKSGASATTVEVTATVKNSAGSLLGGVPVTFAITGTGAAVTSTTTTAYTTSSGVATANVYGWIAGTYTVTATAGGKSGTGTITFAQRDTVYVRTITATANGSVVVAKVKDRYDNGVYGVTVYASKTGDGYFGDGKTKTSGITDANGEVEFALAGQSGTVTVSLVNPSDPAGTTYGQSSAAKGYVDNAATPTAITAYTAGTTATAETGVGAAYDAAGNTSASVDVTVTGSSDSVDAANEATDAANAATDAANAAAEAADAATAAAQDAQAAVAALATEVAAMISGIKAQIIRLTNLVVKIQKKVKA